MDDGRIAALTQEVLSQLHGEAPAETRDLESRVAALEATLRSLTMRLAAAEPHAPAPGHAHEHASLHLLAVSGGGTGACVLEPDKPCVSSGQCRTFGH